MSDFPEVAGRYKLAAYWWLASELIRRNPKLALLETYPVNGFYDCLTLLGNTERGPVHIDLNRAGSVHVHPDHIGFMKAMELVTHENPHWAMKRIEEAAGLTPTATAPGSSARVITVRIMARLLNFLVNDRARWDLRMMTPERSGYAVSILDSPLLSEETPPLSGVFPSADDFHAFMISSRFMESFVSGRFWALKRDDVVVAIFDTKGVVHTAQARTYLKPLYARTNRNLTQTMAVALADLLP